MNKILLSFGTRPELIKLAPIIHELKKQLSRDRLLVVHTGQHNELIKRDLAYFQIQPDYHFVLDRSNANLSCLTSELLKNFSRLFQELKAQKTCISTVMGQGDTASTYATALHAFHERIPFVHIEAGLRTFDLGHPFPEEFYRKSISMIAKLHFCPTQTERDYLIKEGVSEEKIWTTGNTVIDNLKKYVNGSPKPIKHKAMLITLHRRELSEQVCNTYIQYIHRLALANKDWNFIWLSHPGKSKMNFSLNTLPNFKIIPPLSYAEIQKMYSQISLILTDSGGLQEEAAYLGIPCIVARQVTERTQGMDSSIAQWIDINQTSIPHLLQQFDSAQLTYQNEIYGDGKSAKKIVEILLQDEKLSYQVFN